MYSLKKLNLVIVILCSLVFCKLARSQQGNKYIHNFSPFDYKASDQNWCSVQDSNGIMYFANLSGVLVYDGKFWKTIRLPKVENVYSLDINHKNQVFVGADNEFGLLVKKANGELVYQSLSDSLKKEEKNFAQTWATYCIDEDVFFCSNDRVFRYHNNKITPFTPEKDRFHTFFKINNHLFVREYEVGFKVFENDQLRFVLGSEIFADMKVYSILKKNEDDFIVASRNGGLFMMKYNFEHPSQSSFEKVQSEADVWFNENDLYCGRKIDNDHFAFGALKNGVIIIDRNYRITSTINTGNGLHDDAVKHISKDANNNLWLCLNNGLAYFENSIPVSYWKEQEGVNGTVKFKGLLYIATDKGLKVYDKKTNSFIATDITSPCHLLSKSVSELFITSDEGTYSYNGVRYNPINEETSYSCQFNERTQELYIGTDNGLIIYDSKSVVRKSIPDLGEIRSIAFDKNGNCGLGTGKNGVYIIQTNNVITNITTKEGLPSTVETNVFELNGQLVFCTDFGFYEYDFSSKKVKRMTELNAGKTVSVLNAFKIKEQLWFQYTKGDKIKERLEEISIIGLKNGKYQFLPSSLNRIQNATIKHFLQDSDVVYISSNQGLYCYKLGEFQTPKKFNVVLSRAWFANDTISFLENYTDGFSYEAIEIPYNKNELHILPAATSFYESDKTEFSYYLEGKETTYKDWVVTNIIEYNNLPEREYTLHIKAKDIFGNITPELTFKFVISPPWYRTVWAYIIYAISIIALVILIIKLYTRRLKERNLILEETINLRTKTIVEQKHELEYKNKEIVDSINYAQRIQRSLLASDAMLKKNLGEYFVFFKPKDIVSGDFYWGAELNNGNFALVTADSTGHGVPGAIMSMLNISCLNEAIEGQKLNQTADILNYTRDKVIKHLSNDGSIDGGKDGMDCSLISFDMKNKQFTYSAANNPVWIVREGTIIELKADKMPVGKHDKDSQSFSQQSFAMQKGDVVYTLTDGMPDQFGGPKGKKFMYKQLKELLLSISHLPMNEQREKLYTDFTDWKTNLEQIDDVLIIGVRIS